MWNLLREAGIERRRDVVTWNIVPWYVGDGTRIRAATVKDVDEAAPSTRELLSLLPEVRVVVLLGKWASRGWKRLEIATLPAIEAPHPSPLSVNTTPGARERLLGALIDAHARAAAGP